MRQGSLPPKVLNGASTFSAWFCSSCWKQMPSFAFQQQVKSCCDMIEQWCQWKYKGNFKTETVFGFLDPTESLWPSGILCWEGSWGHLRARYEWALRSINGAAPGKKWRNDFILAHVPGMCRLDPKRWSAFPPFSSIWWFTIFHLCSLST